MVAHLTGLIESNYDEITDSFDSMDLKPELLRGMSNSQNPSPPVAGYVQKIPNFHSGVYAYGFERPSAIQQRAIMPIIKGEFFR